MLSALSLLVAQALVIPPPPPAAPRRLVSVPQNYDSPNNAWRISMDVLESADAGQPLKGKSTILRQRLLPKRLAVVEIDVEQSDGSDRWARKGDFLFGARVDGVDVFCVLPTKTNMSLSMILVPAPDKLLKQDCFVDEDGDGRFDVRYEGNPGIGVLPKIESLRAGTKKPLAPAAYRTVDPGQFEPDNWVELRYRGGGTKPGKPARFEIRYRYDGKTRSLTQRFLATEDGERQVLKKFGGRVVLAEASEGKLTATIEHPMDADFSVSAILVRR